MTIAALEQAAQRAAAACDDVTIILLVVPGGVSIAGHKDGARLAGQVLAWDDLEGAPAAVGEVRRAALMAARNALATRTAPD